MHYKYFVPGKKINLLNLDVDTLRWFRRHFPGCHYIDGKWKNKSGVYVVSDVKNRKYGDHYKSKRSKELGIEVEFWEPVDPQIEPYFRNKKQFLNVELDCGEFIKICPASCEPKQAIFGDDDDEEEEKYQDALLYNKKTDYGALGYELYYEYAEGHLLLTDSRVKRFAMLAILNSYNINIDLLNAWGKIVQQDFANIMLAGLGFDVKKKEISDHDTTTQGSTD